MWPKVASRIRWMIDSDILLLAQEQLMLYTLQIQHPDQIRRVATEMF